MKPTPLFQDNKYLGLLLICTLAIFIGCTSPKVINCFDCATIKIPENDNTPPTFMWAVTNRATGETRTFTTSGDSVVVHENTSFEVTLIAKDPDGGIKEMQIVSMSEARFCRDPGTGEANAVSGISTMAPVDLSNLSPALKEWRISFELQIGIGGCAPPFKTEKVIRGVSGRIENHHGGVLQPSLEFIGRPLN